MSNLRLSRSNTAKFAGLTAGIIVALAGGCGGENEDLKKIAKAEQEISVLTAGGTFATTADAYRRKQLVEIGDSMDALAKTGNDNIKGAANSIAARAKAGIAAIDSKLAVEADRGLDAQLTELRAGLNTYTLQKSIATANNGAGTEGLIKTLQTSLEANKKASGEAAKAASKIQASVDELDTRAKAVAAQAAAKREQASSITARMQGATATEGLEIIKQAAAVRAEADGLEQKAAEINTRLDLTKAELARARAAVSALDDQAKQLQQDIAGANTRLEEEHKLAASAGKAADEASAALTQKLAELGKYRSGSLDTAHAAAVTSTQKAVQLAKTAANSGNKDPQGLNSGNTSKLNTATMELNYADALVSQARANDRIAGTLSLLASSQPALPNAAEIEKVAADTRKAADDTLTQARELYAKIKEDLDKIGDEKLKSRLGETSRLLEALSSKQGVQPIETPAGAVADTNPEVTAVRRVIDQMQDKMRAGDFAGLVNEYVYFANDSEREPFDAIIKLQAAAKAFDAACKDKLGVSGAEAAGPMGAGLSKITNAGGNSAEANKTSSDYDIVIDASGTKATCTDKTTKKPDQMVKVNGKWLAVIGDEMKSVPLEMLAPMQAVLEQVTADIKSGKITDAQQLQAAMMAKFGAGMRPGGRRPAGGNDDPNK